MQPLHHDPRLARAYPFDSRYRRHVVVPCGSFFCVCFKVVALGIELSVVTLSGSPGLPVLDYRFVLYLGCRPMLSAGPEAREHTRFLTAGARGRQPLSSPYGNRTHLSALKGQYPSPIDERAVVQF